MKKQLKKLLMVCFAGFCAMLMFGVNVNAYIDPSVMTYMIQLVAGIVIAVGAVIGVYLRKAKKKVSEKLGIDENRNKEIETDEIIADIDDMEE